jgi:hypothetical protein
MRIGPTWSHRFRSSVFRRLFLFIRFSIFLSHILFCIFISDIVWPSFRANSESLLSPTLSFFSYASLTDFIAQSKFLTPLSEPVDLMHWIPFDAEGCALDRFFTTLSQARRAPISPRIPRSGL